MTLEFIHRWYMPFAWIAVCSLLGAPLAAYFEYGMQTHAGAELGIAYGNSWVLRDDFLAAIMPYVLNLGCATWLFSANGSTRWAAFWALIVAIAHIAAPFTLATTAGVAAGGGQHYVDWSTLRMLVWFQDFQMFAFGIILWAAFGRFVGQSSSASPSSTTYAEAH